MTAVGAHDPSVPSESCSCWTDGPGSVSLLAAFFARTSGQLGNSLLIQHRIESFELNAGVGSGELPVDRDLGLIAPPLPGVRFLLQRCPVGGALLETLARQHRADHRAA